MILKWDNFENAVMLMTSWVVYQSIIYSCILVNLGSEKNNWVTMIMTMVMLVVTTYVLCQTLDQMLHTD